MTKKSKENEDVLELPEAGEEVKQSIKVEKAIDSRDVERIIKRVLQHKIVLVNLKGIKNISDYQTTLKEFKRFANMYKFNMILIDDDFLLLTSKDVELKKL